MKFGIPTLIELKSLKDCVALCKELGLQFVELNMNLPEYQAERIDADAFAKTAERYGIYYTIHLDENLNPCDFNEKVADAHTDAALQTIELDAHAFYEKNGYAKKSFLFIKFLRKGR